MTKYWPYRQSIELNREVAYLFFQTRHKFSYNLINKTQSSLYTDLLDNIGRGKLFSIVLMELEVLILDLIELDLCPKSLNTSNSRLFFDLLHRSWHRFLLILNDTSYLRLRDQDATMLKIISSEHMFLLEYLLVYLIFGASEINKNVFLFDNHRTPKEHVSVLLENFVTQFGNLIIYKLLKNFVPLTSAVYFINNNHLCNSVYISIRSIALFFNTLTVERFLYLYFNKPKQICNSRYKVSIISSSGLVVKYIYLFRSNDISCLSRFQLFVLFLIEIQDILIPQLEKFVLISSKITFYILVNFLGNSAIFCIRSILSGINTLQK